MTKAVITKTGGYQCAPNGHTTETYLEGEVVTGLAADFAVADNAAREIKPTAPTEAKVTKPAETKAKAKPKAKASAKS